MKSHFQTFASYNRWANERLYDAAAELDAAALRQRRPAAYFGSILGTLNHLLLVDQLWFDRIKGAPARHTALDTLLYEDFADLRAARRAEDREIMDWIDALPEERLGESFTYQTLTAGEMSSPLHWTLAHVFNHQTHHRGQAHALLKDAGVKPPALDLLYYLRDPG